MLNPRPVSFMNNQLPGGPGDPEAAILDALQRMVENTTSLIERTALQLGLDEASARLAGKTFTLKCGERTIAIVPMPPNDNTSDELSLVLSVQTNVPLLPTGQVGDAVTVLQHAPGVLHAFAASLGATPEGFWVVLRTVRVSLDDGAALALYMLETVCLANFVLLGRPHLEH